MKTPVNTGLYTYGDFIAWSDTRCELVEGFQKIMAGVSQWHTRVTLKMSGLLSNFWDKKGHPKYFVFHAPFDVILFPEEELLKSKTVVQPDLGVCSKEKRKGRVILGAPELVIEVTSSNLDYDFRTKYDLYERAGVLEYWVITPKENIITVFILDKETGKFNKSISYELELTDKIKSEVIEGLEFELRSIFDFRGLE